MTNYPKPAVVRRIACAPTVLRLLMAGGLSVLLCASPAARDAARSGDSGHARRMPPTPAAPPSQASTSPTRGSSRHDTGVAPAELTATWADRPGSRKLCAWPRKAVYVAGDAEDVGGYGGR